MLEVDSYIYNRFSLWFSLVCTYSMSLWHLIFTKILDIRDRQHGYVSKIVLTLQIKQCSRTGSSPPILKGKRNF